MPHYESSKESPFFTLLDCPPSCNKPGHFETEKQAIQQAVTRLAADLADAAWTYRRFKANMRDAKRRIVSKASLFQEAVSDLGDHKAFADSLAGLAGLCRKGGRASADADKSRRETTQAAIHKSNTDFNNRIRMKQAEMATKYGVPARVVDAIYEEMAGFISDEQELAASKRY